ncbi:exported hypothetical protein [Candidatus Competibacter denitrificans Run_A_D11]|uniref:DUF4124 domain-containing protein n=1 Tax=Candidatus Competibacter denitrificans Run_A_D11 TaxID=1400863 RepID=W6M811_9GAMM|nr:DUF4124 domain-containing protein [Candidatus Competibacter denitrificans]CDI03747.1 exported hypothetical protein [Candidatus Competibacter denitrificans Run_A_D11]
MMKRIVLLSCALMSAPAVAINKCVDADGKTVYQAAPCAGAAKGSEIAIQKAPPVSEKTESEDLKRFKEAGSAMERDRKILETEREIAAIEGRISDNRQAMSGELAALRNKKNYANNNLAGATWEQSISDEMTAVTQKYDTLVRSDQSRIDGLRQELARLRDKK